MGVGVLLEDVMAVEQTRSRPKPDSFGFLRLMKKHGVKAAQCGMVEESGGNLDAAKGLGKGTGWGKAGGGGGRARISPAAAPNWRPGAPRAAA